jgi:hypothetical protein
MLPEQPGSRGPAHLLQQALAAGLAALALGSALALLQGLREAWEMRTRWVQIPAVNGGLGGEGLLEAEVAPQDAARLGPVRRPQHPAPYKEGHVRILVADRPYSSHSLAGPLDLALHPTEPGRVQIVSALADASLAVARLVWLLLLGGAAWYCWRHADWGRDTTWDGAGWAASAMRAERPGATACGSQVLRETETRRRWLMVLCAITGVLALWNLIGLAVEGTANAPIEAGFWTLGTFVLFAPPLWLLVRTRTRRVRWDDAGVADADWFGVRRVPWPAIASWQRVNTNAQAQARHDRMSLGRRKGRRPPDLWMWVAQAADGSELLRLPLQMEPGPAQAVLFERIERQVHPAGRFDPRAGFSDARDERDAALSEPESEGEAQAAFEAHQASVDRGFRWGFVVIVAPFALLFLAPTWSALKYELLADRIEGEVVAVDGHAEVPQLTVRYPGADGKPLELRTDGSRANQGIAVGARVPVLRPKSSPEDAKTADFWSVWIWPVITGVLLLIVAVPFWIGFVHLPRREARRRAARRGAGQA